MADDDSDADDMVAGGLACIFSPERIAALGAGVSLSAFVRIGCYAVAVCMLGPCVSHSVHLDELAMRVADLGAPFDAAPLLSAIAVCLAETLGTLAILLRLAPRLGAAALLPKMAVAVYGHAFVGGFDDKFARAYANAWHVPGTSYNWSIGSSWDCGFFGAGYFLLAYVAIALNMPPLPSACRGANEKKQQ